MRFLLLSACSILFACSQDHPSPQAHLPALGSAEAEAAHTAYHAWIHGLPDVLEGTHATYEFRFAAEVGNTRGIEGQGGIGVEGKLTAAHGDAERLRIEIDLGIDPVGDVVEDLPTEVDSTYQGGMILDGSLLWLKAESGPDGLFPAPGYAFRMDQETALEVYGNITQIEEEEAAKLQRALPGSLPFFQAWEAATPSRLEHAIQPKGMLLWSAPFLTCRSFQRIGDEVVAELNLDLREGSGFQTMVKQAIQGLKKDAALQAREFEDLLEQVEHNLDLVGHWEASTGVLRSLELEVVIRGQEMRSPQDGDFHLTAHITGVARALTEEELQELLSRTYPRASNVDGLIKLAIDAGEFEVAEGDSGDEDYAF